jgi:UDP-glucuronate 4-epimerase
MNQLDRKNILVTGGAGFIGSHLIDALLELNFNVICIDNFDPFYDQSVKLKNLEVALKTEKFILLRADICDKNALAECFNKFEVEVVVHLAAKAGVRPSIADPDSYYATNVIGTLNLLEAMKNHNVSKMIFATSSSVYGNNTKVPFSEADSVDSPISHYAATKKAGELLCHVYHHLYGFHIYCMRFFTVFGPRQRPDLAIHKFTNLILNNQKIPIFGDGSTSRDYTYVDDIIDGLLSAIESIKGFEIINLGESRTITLNYMIEVLEEALGRKSEKSYFPMEPGDVMSTFADISKAKNLLGYNPSWSFENGIRNFVDWKKS